MNNVAERLVYLMISCDHSGLLYYDIIDRNVEKMLMMGIDLKIYFASNICFHKIESPFYPLYH